MSKFRKKKKRSKTSNLTQDYHKTTTTWSMEKKEKLLGNQKTNQNSPKEIDPWTKTTPVTPKLWNSNSPDRSFWANEDKK